jgi:hypothetical protein
MTSTKLAAIPTMYKGVQFRSRLEARVACFFDVLEWPWDYEPVDLAGYIPDFVLKFPYRPVLAEVKPFDDIADPQVKAAQEKIQRAGWKNDAIIVGCKPWLEGETGIPWIGSQGDYVHSDPNVSHCWQWCGVFICKECKRHTMVGGDDHCVVTGCRAHGPVSPLVNSTGSWLIETWNWAGNKVQYKGSEAQP